MHNKSLKHTKVMYEKTEEPFDEQPDGNDVLPTVGNGAFLVKMRLKKDLPNWVPMYGRKVCLDFIGARQLRILPGIEW